MFATALGAPPAPWLHAGRRASLRKLHTGSGPTLVVSTPLSVGNQQRSVGGPSRLKALHRRPEPNGKLFLPHAGESVCPSQRPQQPRVVLQDQPMAVQATLEGGMGEMTAKGTVKVHLPRTVSSEAGRSGLLLIHSSHTKCSLSRCTLQATLHLLALLQGVS